MIIASIDIGTNTVLLLVGETDPKTKIIKPLLNEYRMPRLGSGLKQGGNIKEEKIRDLFEILEDYSRIINNSKVQKVLLTATNSFRIAANSLKIKHEIKTRFGWDLKIISGKKEAEFAYLGAISNNIADGSWLVIDIGGGSTELISGSKNNIQFSKSFKLGSVNMTETYLSGNPPSNEQLDSLDDYLSKIFEKLILQHAPGNAVAISGTPTTIFCMINMIKKYEDDLVEGGKIKHTQLKKLIKEIEHSKSQEIKNIFGSVLNGREDIILAGALILLKIMELYSLPEVIVSSRGIRYGAIISYLNHQTD